MASIEGAPYSDAHLTRVRHNLRSHASMGLEASLALHAFAARFARKLNQAAEGVDMTAPEAMGFRAAWQTLRDEVSAFLDLIVLSNPEQLAEMAKQTGKFERKLAQLPRVGKPRQQPKTPYLWSSQRRTQETNTSNKAKQHAGDFVARDLLRDHHLHNLYVTPAMPPAAVRS